MSDELDEIVDNIQERSFWIRIVFMIAFAIASYIIILPLIIVLSIAQALFTLVTGQVNANLRYFSATLALYTTQIIQFLTYLSDDKPYPFSELPEVEDESAPSSTKERAASKDKTQSAASSATDKKPAAAKKKSAKSAAVKKKAVKKKSAKSEPPEDSEGNTP